MENRKATKRALLTSITALVMCVVMLAGTTLAWFTDTASTNVNKIQAGKLDVQLMMATAWDADGNPTDWDDAEDKTLNFLVNGAVPAQNTQILWEPGCTYKLPELKVVNNGNLALKYEIAITGVTGSAKLLDAIKFTAKVGDSTTLVGLNDLKGVILPTGMTASNNNEAVGETPSITISGTMDTNANNDYMNLSIDGISITVNATQASYEYDSNGKNYDEDAVTPVSAQAVGDLNIHDTTSTTATVKDEQTISDGTMSVTYPADVTLTDVNATGESGSMKTSVTQKLEYTGDTLSPEATSAGIEVADGKAVAQYKLILPVDTNNTTLIRIAVNYAKNLGGLEIYHNGLKLPTTAAAAGEPVREYFTYDRDTGVLELYLFHASPIDIIYNASNVLKGATGVSTADELTAAVKKDGVVYLKNDIEVSSALSISKTVTLDLNGYTLTGTASNTIKVVAGGNLTVQDTSAAQNGKIANTYSGKAGPTTVDMTGAGATFTLLSGTVESNAKDDLHSLAIGNSKQRACTVNIAGGTVANPDKHVDSRAISASKGMNLNISGGTVSGGLYGVDVYEGSTTTITGGTITARGKVERADEYGTTYAIHAKGEAVLTIGSATVTTVPEVGGIKFESSGVKTELPTITLLRGNITKPIYSLETKYNYKLFKLGIAANAPVTFVDDTAHFFLTDDLKMTQGTNSIWTVTKSAT